MRHQRVLSVKVGALGGRDNVRAVARLLARHPDVPVVVDTPIAPTRGKARLLATGAARGPQGRAPAAGDARDRERRRGPRAPRRARAHPSARRTTPRARSRRSDPRAALVKGGHLTGDERDRRARGGGRGHRASRAAPARSRADARDAAAPSRRSSPAAWRSAVARARRPRRPGRRRPLGEARAPRRARARRRRQRRRPGPARHRLLAGGDEPPGRQGRQGDVEEPVLFALHPSGPGVPGVLAVFFSAGVGGARLAQVMYSALMST